MPSNKWLSERNGADWLMDATGRLIGYRDERGQEYRIPSELVPGGIVDDDEPAAGAGVPVTGIVQLAGGRTADLGALAELPGGGRIAAPIVPWDTTIAELRRAATAAANEGRRFRIPRADITLTEPWTLDVSKVKSQFEDTVFTAGHGDDVLTLVGRQSPTYWNSKMGIDGFAIVGAGEGEATSRGLVLSDSEVQGGAGVSGPNRVRIQNFVVTQAGRGIVHFDRSYGEHISNYAVFDCGIGIQMPNLATDAGEGSTHDKGFVFQCSEWGASIEGTHGTFMHWRDMHFDHNVRQIRVMGRAHVTSVNMHMEHSDYVNGPPILIGPDSGSELNWIGGALVLTKAAPRLVDYIADLQTPAGHGGLSLSGKIRFHRAWTNTGYFATGTGTLDTDGFSSVADDNRYINPFIASAAQNRLIDGGFEQSGAFDTLPDKIQITNDTAAITRRLTGSNITIQRNTAASGRNPRTGNGFMTVRHLGAAGSEGRFMIASRVINPRQRFGWRFWARKPAGLNVGGFTINPVYCALMAQGRARTTAADTQDVDTIWQNLRTIASEPAIIVNFANMPDGWVEFKSRGWGIVSALPYVWATDMALFIDPRQIDGTGGAAVDFLDIDDAEFGGL